MFNKLIIGTANFGARYGYKKHKISKNELNKIFKFCKKNKINSYDTAFSYKNSETTIGKYNLNGDLIYSKIPQIPKDTINIEQWIFKKFFKSLSSLGLKKIEGIYLHHQEDLLRKKSSEIYKTLIKLKKFGYVKKVGVSIYDLKKLKKIISLYNIDMVQVPINIFDRRFLDKQLINLITKKKIELNARSIFLQGILLKSRKNLNKKFLDLDNKTFKNWYSWIAEKNISQLDACISFIKSIKTVSNIIIGINNLEQLKMIFKSLKKNKKYSKNIFSKKNKLIDIRKW